MARGNMTKEEAIARVKHQRDWANEVNRMLDVEAFDMAAEALEDIEALNAINLDLASENEDLVGRIGKLRWIPITERLPDNSGRYLVNYSSGYIAMAYYYESVSKWGSTTIERIVAWQSLPEPYKAESDSI